MTERIYNKIHKIDIILNPDQKRCPRCLGAGYNSEYDGDDYGEYNLIECHLCDGDGYVDWVALAVNSDWEEYDKKRLEEEEGEAWEEAFWEEVEDCHNSSFDIDEDWEDRLGYG